MKVTRMGHACIVVVGGGGARIMIDPGNLSAPEAFSQTGLDAIIVTHPKACLPGQMTSSCFGDGP